MKPFTRLLLGTLLLLAACKDKDSNPVTPAKETFVLLHGAWAGAYAWTDVKPRLEAKGYKVVLVELPAHGDDQTPVPGLTFDSYVNKVLAAVPFPPPCSAPSFKTPSP